MDGYVTIGTLVDTKEFDAQITYIESKMLDIEDKLKQADMGFEVGDTQKLEAEYEKLGNQLIGLKEKQEKYNQSIREAQLAGFDKIKASIDSVKAATDNIGNSLKNVTTKVVNWGLAVFGIRSAYNAVRSAMSTIASQDKQLAADIDYMKNALAYTLEPVVRGIVNLMKTLMFYVGYVVKAWTGKDIFANANKSLKGTNDGLKSATGNAKNLNKELNKTTAGFDEMNTLQDNSSSGSGGGGAGGGGATLPSFDLTAPQDFPIPKWLQWIVDNKDIVIAGLAGIAAGLIALKLGASGLLALGIGLVVGGIVLLIQDIIKFIKDPSWDNFANILRDLAIILAGVAIAMLAVNAANPVAWILLAIAAVVALVAAVIKNWDKIKAVLAPIGQWIYDHIIQPVVKFFQGLWDTIVKIFTPVVQFFGNIFKTAFDNVKIAIDNLKQIFSLAWNFIKGVFGPVVSFFKDVFDRAVKIVKKVFGPIVDFFSGIWDKVKSKLKAFGAKVGEVIGGAFKAVINGVLNAIENILNFPVKSINKLIDVINKVPGINLTKFKTYSLPRLAKGGIINMPGKGVPVGSAIAGERGQEGVLPLTDSQQMALLGEAIGRYITINANITNTMNGRVISRELQKINNESDFAYNR